MLSYLNLTKYNYNLSQKYKMPNIIILHDIQSYDSITHYPEHKIMSCLCSKVHNLPTKQI